MRACQRSWFYDRTFKDLPELLNFLPQLLLHFDDGNLYKKDLKEEITQNLKLRGVPFIEPTTKYSTTRMDGGFTGIRPQLQNQNL